MIENQALLSLIIANPDDDQHRLLYADWLEQHGQRDRARLIRVQIELARLRDKAEAATAVHSEEEQLLAVCEKSLRGQEKETAYFFGSRGGEFTLSPFLGAVEFTTQLAGTQRASSASTRSRARFRWRSAPPRARDPLPENRSTTCRQESALV